MVFGVLYTENLKFYTRTRRFQVILPVFALLSALEPALIIAGVIPKPTDVYSFTQGALGQFSTYALLVCAVLAGDAISRDFSREGYFTLTQPVRRSQIMLARFLSAFTAALIVLLVTVAIGVGFSEYLYSSVVPNILLITLIGLLYAAALTAFVMMFSSLSKSPSLSIVAAILVLIVAMPIVQSIVEFLSRVEPWFLITYASNVISNLAGQTYPPHLVAQKLGSRTLYLYSPGVVEGVLIMVGYLVLSGIAAWVVYSRRELK
ncbi:MAG: ABC transporter permease [Thermoprotei archaeon]